MNTENSHTEQEINQEELNTPEMEQPQTDESTATTDEASELDKLKAELTEANNKFLYLMSEFQNFKSRTSRERIELSKTAGKDIIVELLPVLDDFERGLETMAKSENVEAVKEGVQLIYNKFSNLMKGRGLQAIDAQNQVFNVEEHEAISKLPAPSEELKNTVLHVVEKGYRLNDSIIRYAKVIVAE